MTIKRSIHKETHLEENFLARLGSPQEQLDGGCLCSGVSLVAATNRPDMIDPALLRPGRLEKILYVPLPPPEGRESILQALTRATALGDDVQLRQIAAMPALNGFSSADLASLVREASVLALKERLKQEDSNERSDMSSSQNILVMRRHFDMSLPRLRPSVSRKDHKMYDSLRLKHRSS